MKVTLRFKAQPGTRRKDQVIQVYDGPALTLADLKEFWVVEQVINAKSHVRVHLEVEE